MESIPSYDLNGYKQCLSKDLSYNGVCCYYRENLNVKERELHHSDSVWLEIDDTVLVGLFNDSSGETETLREMLSSISNLYSEILIFGHLENRHNLELVRCNMSVDNTFMDDEYIISLNNKASCIKMIQRLYLVDFSQSRFNGYCGMYPFIPKRKKTFLYKDYTSANYKEMSIFITNNITCSVSKRLCDVITDFTDLLKKTVSYVPRIQPPAVLCSWANTKMRRKEKELNYVIQIQQQRNSSELEQKLVAFVNAARQAKKNYEKQLYKIYEEDDKDCFKQYLPDETHTFAYIRNKDGVIVEGDKNIANAFSEYFVSVYSVDDEAPTILDGDAIPGIAALVITESKVKSALYSIEKPVTGPDGLGSLLFKNLADILAAPLSMIYQRSLDEGYVPCTWKESRVKPKYKSGDVVDVVNYRAISILCTLVKVMEQLLVDHILEHAKKHNLISIHQHGFLSDKSVDTNLIEFHSFLNSELDKRKCVDIVFLDLRKAFDTVSHNVLLFRLKQCGINGKIFNWIREYLSNREQFVQINTARSPPVFVSSGVPQGSKLANLLFLLFVNNIPDCVRSQIQMYGDDIKLYSVTDTINNNIQTDLDALSEWTSEMKMNFNLSKCKVMHMGANNPQKKYYMKYNDGTEYQIKSVQVHRDLGLFIDNNLTFSEHVDTLTRRAMRIITCMQSRFSFMSTKTFCKYYEMYVRSKLEKFTSIWSSIAKSDKDKIENCQRMATLSVNGMSEMSYSERLKKLKLPTLEHRRLHLDLLQIYRCFSTKQFDCFPSTRRIIVNNELSFLPKRIAYKWNELSDETLMSNNFTIFSSNLENELECDDIYFYQFKPVN